MRTITEPLQATLDSGATTLCWCWRITRSDGQVLGLTEHDRDLSCDGVTYHAASADMGGAAQAATGFSADTSAITAILRSDLISETDLLAGAYAQAQIDLLRVDWSAADHNVPVWRGRIGEVTRTELGFTAELVAMAGDLDRQIGRIIQKRCDAALGDTRCGVDVTASAYAGTGAVTSVIDTGVFLVSGIDAFADDWFTLGIITWTSGEMSGTAAEIARHHITDDGVFLTLTLPPSASLAAGDTFTITAGCDKRWASCKTKFSNTVNFRGFPMIPGDDWLISGPNEADANTGASLWTDRDA